MKLGLLLLLTGVALLFVVAIFEGKPCSKDDLFCEPVKKILSLD